MLTSYLRVLTPNASAQYVITIIYAIILLKYVCMSQLANCRSQYLLDRLGSCLKLFVSTESTSCHEFAYQFGLELFVCEKHPQLSRIPTLTQVLLNETASGRKGAVLTPVTVDRSPATSRNGIGHSGDRLSQTGENQQLKTATTKSLFLHGDENVV